MIFIPINFSEDLNSKLTYYFFSGVVALGAWACLNNIFILS